MSIILLPFKLNAVTCENAAVELDVETFELSEELLGVCCDVTAEVCGTAEDVAFSSCASDA